MILKKLTLAALAAVAWVGAATAPALGAEHPLYKHPKDVEFSFDGVFGAYDKAQLQRGWQVYKEVCAACHALGQLAFRNLTELQFDPDPKKNEAIVKAWAEEYEVPDIDDNGEPIMRKAKLADKKPGPFANERAARAANGGAYPVDQSLIVKARHNGSAYVYSLLTGYSEAPPATFQEKDPDTGKMVTKPYVVQDGLNYNPYFPTTQIAMAQPLQDDQVTYADGTKATVSQMAKDVTAFLTWVAEPKMEQRKEMGLGVMIFLSIFTILAFLSYRKVWADVKKT
jgi:ubiquinol-cytochrome c reductase cytochrome c1 subunit